MSFQCAWREHNFGVRMIIYLFICGESNFEPQKIFKSTFYILSSFHAFLANIYLVSSFLIFPKSFSFCLINNTTAHTLSYFRLRVYEWVILVVSNFFISQNVSTVWQQNHICLFSMLSVGGWEEEGSHHLQILGRSLFCGVDWNIWKLSG